MVGDTGNNHTPSGVAWELRRFGRYSTPGVRSSAVTAAAAGGEERPRRTQGRQNSAKREDSSGDASNTCQCVCTRDSSNGSDTHTHAHAPHMKVGAHVDTLQASNGRPSHCLAHLPTLTHPFTHMQTECRRVHVHAQSIQLMFVR
eukprot:GHVU01126152.1.p1 GENE.GHVU01126152.1~~GHVU01126152.1.p1  ORF type:complete len:145 (-),score=1.98 GHVU01126152.1:47-481(-)